MNSKVSPYNTFRHRPRLQSHSGNALNQQLGTTFKISQTNQVTTILHHKPSYINYRILLAPWIFSAHKSSCTQISCSQLHVTVQLHFILFSRLDFNIETTVMVTSLLLSFHHAVTALILIPNTVGTVVLTSRPGRFTPGKYTGAY